MMTFDPEQNRIQTGLLTADELAALKDVKHGWQRCRGGDWLNTETPSWDPVGIYRAKPAPAPTIIVNGIEVPEPVRAALTNGDKYWLADPTDLFPHELTWNGDKQDIMWLNRGLIHLNEADAVAHAKAMLAPSMRERQDTAGKAST